MNDDWFQSVDIEICNDTKNVNNLLNVNLIDITNKKTYKMPINSYIKKSNESFNNLSDMNAKKINYYDVNNSDSDIYKSNINNTEILRGELLLLLSENNKKHKSSNNI